MGRVKWINVYFIMSVWRFLVATSNSSDKKVKKWNSGCRNTKVNAVKCFHLLLMYVNVMGVPFA